MNKSVSTLVRTVVGETRWRLFLGVNLLVLGMLGFALGSSSQVAIGLVLYVQTMAILCMLPLCWTRSLRGPMALLVLLMAMIFVHFGLRDLVAAVTGMPLPARGADLFTAGEAAAVATAVCALLGYALVSAVAPGRSGNALAREWSPTAITVLGVACWAIGFGLSAYHLLTVADLQKHESYTNSFAGVLALLRFLQPIGTALLAYLLIAQRRRGILPILIATIVCDIVLGYIGDSKESSFRGLLIVMIAYVFLRDRLPIVRGLLVMLVVGASFSYFAAYRDLLATSKTTREAALGHIGEILTHIADGGRTGSRALDGLDYFTWRLSLKENLELIVRETGRSVPFQEGKTMIGVLYTFLPRFVFPDKPQSATGQAFNVMFGISSVATTYISQGVNGELYWNFGWPGLLLGMTVVGAIVGYASHMLDLQVRSNAPRFLFLVTCAYELCIRFEGNFTVEYSYLMRALVLLWLLHLVMPKARAVQLAGGELAAVAAAAHALQPRKPNFVALPLADNRRSAQSAR